MNDRLTPDQVPGYQEAQASLQLPVVPATPPKPVSVNSMMVLVACIATFFISGIGAIQISNAAFSPTWLDVSLFIIPLIAGVAAFYLPGRAKDKELAAGYAYVDDAVMTYGTPSFKKLFKIQNQAGPAGYQWNFRGVWKLNYNGSVNRPPVAGILPVGYYPSPTRTNAFEYWTGAEWMGRFLDKNEIPQGGRLIP